MLRFPCAARACLISLTSLAAYGQPVIQSLLSPSMEESWTAPGAVLVLKGSGFATQTRVAIAPPLPKTLAGARVLIDDLECPLLFVSPDTIQAQLPFGITSHRSSYGALVKVRTAEGDSAESTIPLVRTRPVLVTQSRDGQGEAVVLDENRRPMRSLKAGDTVIFEAMGLGDTDPLVEAGQDSGADLKVVKELVEVYFGDTKAELLSAGLAPGMAGIYDVKVRVPENFGNTVRIVTEGMNEHSAALPTFPSGAKVADVAGDIDAGFAVPSRPVGFSPVLVAAKFSLALTVLPGTQPFDIVLENEVARVNITVNPADGTFEGTAVVPTAVTRAGDFSGATQLAIDFMNGGLPFPANHIPMSRWPPEWARATQLMAMPNDGGAAPFGTGIVRVKGRIPSDGRLILTDETAPGLLAEGWWRFIPDNYTKIYATSFRLLVDGTEIARKDVTIPVQ